MLWEHGLLRGNLCQCSTPKQRAAVRQCGMWFMARCCFSIVRWLCVAPLLLLSSTSVDLSRGTWHHVVTVVWLWAAGAALTAKPPWVSVFSCLGLKGACCCAVTRPCRGQLYPQPPWTLRLFHLGPGSFGAAILVLQLQQVPGATDPMYVCVCCMLLLSEMRVLHAP